MDRQRLINLTAAIAAVTVFGFTMGLMFPLLALILESRGVAPDMIGYNTAMQPVGILIAGFIAPRLVKTYGAKSVVVGAAFGAAAVILVYPFLSDFRWWFPLRICHGMMVSILFSISESWIVKFAIEKWRTRILAVYTSVLSISFGGGPLLIKFGGIDTLFPFVAGALILVVATIPLLLVRDDKTDEHDSDTPLSAMAFAPKAPLILLAVLAFAVIDAACLGFLPVYGVKKGMDQGTAALALSAFVFGNVVLQFPIGWLADHMPKRRVIIGCALATGLAISLVPLFFGTPIFWFLLLIAGAASAGIYTVSLSELGERFSGADLIAGSAAFSTMWGGGALLGAVIAGWAFGFGPDGMPYVMGAIFIAFTAMMIVANAQRRQRDEPQSAQRSQRSQRR